MKLAANFIIQKDQQEYRLPSKIIFAPKLIFGICFLPWAFPDLSKMPAERILLPALNKHCNSLLQGTNTFTQSGTA